MNRLTRTTTALLCVFACVTATADGYKANDKAPALSIKKEGKQQQVLIDGKLFVGYNTKDAAKPFLYPIIGPTGANMTRHYPMKKGVAGESDDHPHHTSFWFTHGGVNGVDLWHGKGKAVENVTSIIGQRSPHRAAISAKDRWLKKDQAAIAEVDTLYVFTVLEDDSRVIDYQTNIEPAKGIEQLLFADTKEGTMAIRLAPQLRLKGKVATGKAINSEGVTGKDVWGKRAKWVAYWGEIDGETCGVAIFDHPTNLRHPTWWHARDYGLVAANPFGISDFEKKPKGTGDYTLKQGEELKFQYRFVFFAGTAEEADIAGKYASWADTQKPANADKQAEWTPLFNGEDLSGWHTKPGGEWKVVDGTIVGTSEKEEKRHGLLVSDQAYSDFEAKLKFKVTEGNSGFYFRSTPVDHAVGIKGFQAEVDRTVATGGLYETLGRAWVKKPAPKVMDELYKAGEWADMTVYAKGGNIKVSINGKQVVELEGDKGAAQGHFALQLHGGQVMDVAFKDIYIREITAD